MASINNTLLTNISGAVINFTQDGYVRLSNLTDHPIVVSFQEFLFDIALPYLGSAVPEQVSSNLGPVTVTNAIEKIAYLALAGLLGYRAHLWWADRRQKTTSDAVHEAAQAQVRDLRLDYLGNGLLILIRNLYETKEIARNVDEVPMLTVLILVSLDEPRLIALLGNKNLLKGLVDEALKQVDAANAKVEEAKEKQETEGDAAQKTTGDTEGSQGESKGCQGGATECQGKAQGCQEKTQGCQGKTQGCQTSAQGCQTSAQGCQTSAQGCKGGGQECGKGTQGCQTGTKGCQEGTRECKKGSQGCQTGTQGCSGGNAKANPAFLFGCDR
ncbi:hypothetical protein F4778DRAFT_761260 [Xylariomycetidae sp. FL2044]|nr:hypothetical protein F4778DRAFT_761260 [Xylariomycetidae sp. FL2044]